MDLGQPLRKTNELKALNESKHHIKALNKNKHHMTRNQHFKKQTEQI